MSNKTIDAAYKLLKEMNDGHEPYAASVSPTARHFEAFQEEILGRFEKLARKYSEDVLGNGDYYSGLEAGQQSAADAIDDLIAAIREGK